MHVQTTPIVQVETPHPPSGSYVLRSIGMDSYMSSFKLDNVLTVKFSRKVIAQTDFTGLWLQLERTGIGWVDLVPHQMSMQETILVSNSISKKSLEKTDIEIAHLLMKYSYYYEAWFQIDAVEAFVTNL